MNTEQERAEFEAHFSRPPFEWEFHRYGEDSAWPGNYQLYEHQCAWEAYQAGRAALQAQDREDALIVAMQEAVDLLGPSAPSCCGCEYEWNHALRVLRAAIDHARRIEGEVNDSE